MTFMQKMTAVMVCAGGVIAASAAAQIPTGGLVKAVRASLAARGTMVPITQASIGMRNAKCGEFISYENILITSVQDARSPFGPLYIVKASVTVRVTNAALYGGHRSLRVNQCRAPRGLTVLRPMRASFKFDAERRNGRWRIVSG
jgi:hypothetical protein